jgi:very-short-patch-repair endonuclease
VLIAEVDLGWRGLKIAVQYEGGHHRSPGQFAKDIRITREMAEAGWIVIRVTGRDTEATILRLLADAWARRIA